MANAPTPEWVAACLGRARVAKPGVTEATVNRMARRLAGDLSERVLSAAQLKAAAVDLLADMVDRGNRDASSTIEN